MTKSLGILVYCRFRNVLGREIFQLLSQIIRPIKMLQETMSNLHLEDILTNLTYSTIKLKTENRILFDIDHVVRTPDLRIFLNLGNLIQ